MNQVKVIELIIEIDKIVKDDYFYDNVYIEENEEKLGHLSKVLDKLFLNGINEEILEAILKIENKKIFLIDNVNDKFSNNKIRMKIANYIEENEKLKLDFDYVKNYIDEDYRLVQYVEEDRKIELVPLNQKVILLLHPKYLTIEFILEQMKKSSFITEVFLGKYGENNALFEYSKNYKDSKEINDILKEQVKKYLKEDISCYVKSSELVKENVEIAKYVLNLDKKMLPYVNKVINNVE